MKKQNYFRLVLLLVFLYLLGIGFIFFFQKQIIFRPDALKADYSFDFDSPFREIFLPTKDGEKINALYFPSQDTIRGAILYLHGNSDNLQRWGQYHTDFTNRGYAFFAIDYRSYGKSTGKISEQNFYKDARLAYDWVNEIFTPDRIIIYGRSLGTGVASHLATQVPARMLILETPYDNMQNLLLTRMPALPLPFDLEYQFPTDQNLTAVPYPVIIFQGTADNVVPYKSAERLKNI